MINDNNRVSGNTFQCKAKLCKTLPGKEIGESASHEEILTYLFFQYSKHIVP